MKKLNLSRRQFLGQVTAATAFTVLPRHVLGQEQIPPSEKITLAGIGMGGQGIQNILRLQQFPEVQIVAVCDVNREGGGYQSWNWSYGNEKRVGGYEPARQAVDEYYAGQSKSGSYRGCQAYSDYRELLAKEDVDAVMIATPDHTHAVITMAALKMKKHVYCEKPLAWSVHETRLITETARQMKVATQLGNMGQASEESRLVCEMITDGAIGGVREVHTCYGSRFWEYPTWSGRPSETPPVPEGFDWDLWLGPAPQRPYHPAYCPWTWRNWLDFGTGLIGDLGCHFLSTAFKALKLGHPVSVEASSVNTNPELHPLGEILRFEFPARGEMPPVTIVWHDGGLKPPRPKDLEPGRNVSDIIYIGDKGTMMGHRLIPETKMQAYGKPPKILTRSVGHDKEWLDAIRGGSPAGSDFVEHSGLLSEVCMLGNVALRTGEKLEWDGPNMKITNNEQANQFLQRTYREGWSL